VVELKKAKAKLKTEEKAARALVVNKKEAELKKAKAKLKTEEKAARALVVELKKAKAKLKTEEKAARALVVIEKQEAKKKKLALEMFKLNKTSSPEEGEILEDYIPRDVNVKIEESSETEEAVNILDDEKLEESSETEERDAEKLEESSETRESSDPLVDDATPLEDDSKKYFRDTKKPEKERSRKRKKKQRIGPNLLDAMFAFGISKQNKLRDLGNVIAYDLPGEVNWKLFSGISSRFLNFAYKKPTRLDQVITLGDLKKSDYHGDPLILKKYRKFKKSDVPILEAKEKKLVKQLRNKKSKIKRNSRLSAEEKENSLRRVDLELRNKINTIRTEIKNELNPRRKKAMLLYNQGRAYLEEMDEKYLMPLPIVDYAVPFNQKPLQNWVTKNAYSNMVRALQNTVLILKDALLAVPAVIQIIQLTPKPAKFYKNIYKLTPLSGEESKQLRVDEMKSDLGQAIEEPDLKGVDWVDDSKEYLRVSPNARFLFVNSPVNFSPYGPRAWSLFHETQLLSLFVKTPNALFMLSKLQEGPIREITPTVFAKMRKHTKQRDLIFHAHNLDLQVLDDNTLLSYDLGEEGPIALVAVQQDLMDRLYDNYRHFKVINEHAYEDKTDNKTDRYQKEVVSGLEAMLDTVVDENRLLQQLIDANLNQNILDQDGMKDLSPKELQQVFEIMEPFTNNLLKRLKNRLKVAATLDENLKVFVKKLKEANVIKTDETLEPYALKQKVEEDFDNLFENKIVIALKSTKPSKTELDEFKEIRKERIRMRKLLDIISVTDRALKTQDPMPLKIGPKEKVTLCHPPPFVVYENTNERKKPPTALDAYRKSWYVPSYCLAVDKLKAHTGIALLRRGQGGDDDKQVSLVKKLSPTTRNDFGILAESAILPERVRLDNELGDSVKKLQKLFDLVTTNGLKTLVFVQEYKKEPTKVFIFQRCTKDIYRINPVLHMSFYMGILAHVKNPTQASSPELRSVLYRLGFGMKILPFDEKGCYYV
jgi:hypothetical protein